MIASSSRTVTSVVEIDRSCNASPFTAAPTTPYLEERSIADVRRVSPTRTTPRAQGRARGAGRRQRAWMDKGTQCPAQEEDQEGARQVRQSSRASDVREAGGKGQTDREDDRAARRSSRAPQGVASPVHHRLRRPLRRHRGGRQWCVRRPRHLRAGACRPPTRPRRSRGDHGSQWRRQVHPAGAAPGPVGTTRGSAGLRSAVVVGEVDQARTAFESEAALGRAFEEEMPHWTHAQVRTCWQVRPRRRPRRPTGRIAVPGNALGRPSRCQARGSISSSSTSRPITWTCPPSSSWSRRSTPSTAPCCSSPTTGGCWSQCA